MKRLMAVLALAVVLSWTSAGMAQCCSCQPQTVYYAPAPVTTAYYAPTTTYYAPAPTTVYYAPAPVARTAYYAPAPAPIVQTRYRPILGGTVSRVYYPPYRAAYPTIAYYRY